MGGYITWTNNFYVGINGTNQRYHADDPSNWGHMNYDYKQFDIVWQEMSDTEIVAWLLGSEMSEISTLFHTDTLIQEGANVTRFNDLTNAEYFEIDSVNYTTRTLGSGIETIMPPGKENDTLAISCKVSQLRDTRVIRRLRLIWFVTVQNGYFLKDSVMHRILLRNLSGGLRLEHHQFTLLLLNLSWTKSIQLAC